MIELLVVIGIIAVLGTMAFLRFRSIAQQGNANRTRVSLSNAASILAEYEARTQLKRQPPHAWTDAGIPPTYFRLPPYVVPPADPPAFSFWRDFDPAEPMSAEPADEQEGLPAPALVEPGDEAADAAGQTARTGSAAVLNTQIVMYLASQVPANKTLLATLGPDEVMRVPDQSDSADYDEEDVPVLLDAWGNPIIFVPASGLRDVNLGEPPAPFVITSAKVYRATGTTDVLTDGFLAPNARPFFASAGPDGNFSLGDDNLYSFER